jgi:hypothetical protein
MEEKKKEMMVYHIPLSLNLHVYHSATERATAYVKFLILADNSSAHQTSTANSILSSAFFIQMKLKTATVYQELQQKVQKRSVDLHDVPTLTAKEPRRCTGWTRRWRGICEPA